MSTAKEAKRGKEPSTEAFATIVKETVAKLESKLDCRFTGIEQTLKALEEKCDNSAREFQKLFESLSKLQEQVRQQDRKIESFQEQHSDMKRTLERYRLKIIDLENRSRRQNLRLIGVPEKFESGDPIAFFSKFLSEVLGAEFSEENLLLDAVHRISRFKAPDQTKPRHIIVRFHYLHVKERVIRWARKAGMISHQNFRFRIVPDYSAEIMKMRGLFKPVMSLFHQKGFRQVLLFPAQLKITSQDGTRRVFDSPEDAQRFLEE